SRPGGGPSGIPSPLGGEGKGGGYGPGGTGVPPVHDWEGEAPAEPRPGGTGVAPVHDWEGAAPAEPRPGGTGVPPVPGATAGLSSSAERDSATYERMRSAVWEILRAQFLPEFLNRIDEVIIFHPLGREELTQIVELQLRRLEKQLQEKGLRIEATPAAKRQLAEEGFDPLYGARPLKRLIQQRIQNPLANEILQGKHPEGSTVRIDYDGRDFRFENVPQPASVAS
ncbi:MAG: hypothetical protein HY000_37655, partial [Planctomycetes bacterium]|nr:hypothetical protein [Planctomycetota bacterium]